jgi:hypothetical protein
VVEEISHLFNHFFDLKKRWLTMKKGVKGLKGKRSGRDFPRFLLSSIQE